MLVVQSLVFMQATTALDSSAFDEKSVLINPYERVLALQKER